MATNESKQSTTTARIHYWYCAYTCILHTIMDGWMAKRARIPKRIPIFQYTKKKKSEKTLIDMFEQSSHQICTHIIANMHKVILRQWMPNEECHVLCCSFFFISHNKVFWAVSGKHIAGTLHGNILRLFLFFFAGWIELNQNARRMKETGQVQNAFDKAPQIVTIERTNEQANVSSKLYVFGS